MVIHFVFTQLDISFPGVVGGVVNNRTHQCCPRPCLSVPLATFCPTYVLNYLFAACGCLSVGHSIALSIVVSVSGNCVVFISLQYVCALCTLPSSPPRLSYHIAVCFSFLDDAMPCHVTQSGHSSINFDLP